VSARAVLHFAHANGFPAGCYRTLFAALGTRFDVGAIERIGHDPRYPVTDGWPRLVDQLVDHLERRYRTPVIGVGHSLGGFLTFLAAIARPDLFHAIVVMDAPVIGYFKSKALALTKSLGAIDRVTPAAGVRNRRSRFPSREAALAHFRAREPFTRFDPRCLADYVEAGTEPDGDGVRLAFDPRIEYRVYRTLPHDLYRHRGGLRVRAGFMVGRDSRLVSGVDLAYMKRAFGMRFTRVAGGHLFPFQSPDETAEKLTALIARLTTAASLPGDGSSAPDGR